MKRALTPIVRAKTKRARYIARLTTVHVQKEIGPVLNIEIWILISRGHERFVNEIHRRNSDIVNYSSSLRAKDDNLNGVCLESSKLAVVNQGEGLQDSNHVKTKVEPSSMHRETVASLIRVAPASSKSSSGGSGGSSNPTSIHLEAKSIYVKKRSPRRTKI